MIYFSKLLVAFFLLFSYQTKEDKLDGYWQGKIKGHNNEFICTAYFNDGDCVFSKIFPDSFNYKLTDDQILFEPKIPADTFVMNLETRKDSLFMWRNASYSLDVRMKRITGSFINDILTGSNLDIQLPNYSASTTELFDLSRPIEFLIFVEKTGDSVFVHHNKQKYLLDNSTFWHIKKNLKDHTDFNSGTFYLFVDKDLDNSELELLFYNLRLASIIYPRFILESPLIDSFNYIEIRTGFATHNDQQKIPKSLKEFIGALPPPPPGILNMSSSNIKSYNYNIVDFDSIYNSGYMDNIKSNIVTNPDKYILLLDIKNATSFDSLIYLYSEIFDIVNKIRSDYSLENYKRTFDQLDNWEKQSVSKKIKYNIFQASTEEIAYIKQVTQK